MRELDVVRQTRSFLLQEGLAGRGVVDIYTDAHPTLIGDASLRPFQRFTLALEGFTVHPDLVGRLDDGETTFAIEAKGTDDHLRGLAQASCYRFGFHLVFLVGAGRPPADLVTLARQQHVGVLAAYPDRVDVLEIPPALQPRRQHAREIQQQFATTEALQTTFVFNLPTHYLAVAVALHELGHVAMMQLEPRLRAVYPELPRGTQSFRSAVSGAHKLGLVRIRGDAIELTMAGASAAQLLPDLPTLSAIHRLLAARTGGATLDGESGQSGAVLRWLLAGDPVVEMIVATLTDLGGGLITMRVLAGRGVERDRVRALTAFFHPEHISEVTDHRGAVVWSRIEPRHFRSTTFYQYKSILKHAGVIAAHRLGGSSTRDYDPDADIWELKLARGQ